MASRFATYEPRALRVALGIILLAFVLYLVCLSTPYWMILTIPGGVYRNDTEGVTRLIVRHHTGLWRICRVELLNATSPAREGVCLPIDCISCASSR